MARRKDKKSEQSQRDEAAERSKSPASSTKASTHAGTRPKQLPTRKPHQPLPHWRVILHNDDVNYADDVVDAIVMITPLKQPEAQLKTRLAHQSGTAVLLTTHRERAELYVQQFASKHLTVTAEPEK